MTTRKLKILVTASGLFGTIGCNGVNPLIDGCKYASGLNAQCSVVNGGRWSKPAPGFIAEELRAGPAQNTFKVQLRALDSLRVLGANKLLAQRDSIDVDELDEFLINRYLYSYSYSGALQDCLVADPSKQAQALDILTRREAGGRLRYLQIGPPSTLTSSRVASALASIDVVAQLEADFTRILGDAQKAKAAADVAFQAMRTNTSKDFAAGMYRYIMMLNPAQAWSELVRIDAIEPTCKNRGKSVAQGVVVVILSDRKQFVEQTTGTDLSAKLKAALNLSDATAAQLDAAAKLAIDAKIKREARSTLQTELEAPTVVPLRWKADKFE